MSRNLQIFGRLFKIQPSILGLLAVMLINPVGYAASNGPEINKSDLNNVTNTTNNTDQQNYKSRADAILLRHRVELVDSEQKKIYDALTTHVMNALRYGYTENAITVETEGIIENSIKQLDFNISPNQNSKRGKTLDTGKLYKNAAPWIQKLAERKRKNDKKAAKVYTNGLTHAPETAVVTMFTITSQTATISNANTTQNNNRTGRMQPERNLKAIEQLIKKAMEASSAHAAQSTKERIKTVEKITNCTAKITKVMKKYPHDLNDSGLDLSPGLSRSNSPAPTEVASTGTMTEPSKDPEALAAELALKNNQLQSLNEQIAGLEKALSITNIELSKTQNITEANMAETQSEIAKLNDKLRSTQQLVNEKQKDIKVLGDILTAANAAQSNLAAQLVAAEKNAEELAATNTTTEKARAAAAERVNALEQELAIAKNNTVAAAENLDALQQRLAAAEAARTKAAEDARVAAAKLTDAEKNFQELAVDNGATKEELATAAANAARLQQELTTTQTANDVERNGLQQQLADLEAARLEEFARAEAAMQARDAQTIALAETKEQLTNIINPTPQTQNDRTAKINAVVLEHQNNRQAKRDAEAAARKEEDAREIAEIQDKWKLPDYLVADEKKTQDNDVIKKHNSPIEDIKQENANYAEETKQRKLKRDAIAITGASLEQFNEEIKQRYAAVKTERDNKMLQLDQKIIAENPEDKKALNQKLQESIENTKQNISDALTTLLTKESGEVEKRNKKLDGLQELNLKHGAAKEARETAEQDPNNTPRDIIKMQQAREERAARYIEEIDQLIIVNNTASIATQTESQGVGAETQTEQEEFNGSSNPQPTPAPRFKRSAKETTEHEEVVLNHKPGEGTATGLTDDVDDDMGLENLFDETQVAGNAQAAAAVPVAQAAAQAAPVPANPLAPVAQLEEDKDVGSVVDATPAPASGPMESQTAAESQQHLVHKPHLATTIVHTGIITHRISPTSVTPAAAAGDEAPLITRGLWLNTMYAASNQKSVQNMLGYKGASYGGAIGFDMQMKDTLLGIAYSHINSKFKFSDHFNKAAINTHVFTLYGEQLLPHNFALHGIASLAHNHIYNLTDSANNKLDRLSARRSNNYMLEAMVKYNHIFANQVAIIPSLGVKYDHSKIGVHSPNNSGEDAVHSNSKTQRHVSIITGAKVILPAISLSPSLKVAPSFYANFERGLNNKALKINDSRMEEPLTLPKQPKNNYNFGAALTFMHNKNITVSAGCNLNFHKKYKSHEGFLRLNVGV